MGYEASKLVFFFVDQVSAWKIMYQLSNKMKEQAFIQMPESPKRTTLAMFFPPGAHLGFAGWESKICLISLDNSLTTAIVFLTSLESSKALAVKRMSLSFNGHVPAIFPLRFASLTTTPHLSSAAYLIKGIPKTYKELIIALANKWWQ